MLGPLAFGTNVDFVNLVVNPSVCLSSPSENPLLQAQTCIQIALTLECIWNLRNQVAYNESKVNILAFIKNLEHRIMEHKHLLSPVESPSTTACLKWIAPPPDTIKLNVDASISFNSASIAVVARNPQGHIIKCWSKWTPVLDPCIAKAVAISWGDAKICIDAILGNPDKIPWKIRALIDNVSQLISSFNHCCFCWVKRVAKVVAHNLAQFASFLPISFSCTNSNIPPSVYEAWLRDLSSLSS